MIAEGPLLKLGSLDKLSIFSLNLGSIFATIIRCLKRLDTPAPITLLKDFWTGCSAICSEGVVVGSKLLITLFNQFLFLAFSASDRSS